MQAVLAIVNSPKTDVLGITVVTSDAWRDKEVQHTLRLLEIIGRTDTPVVPGAVFPIANIHRDLRHLRWMSLWQSAQRVIRFSSVSSPSRLREHMWWTWRRTELPQYWHRQPSRSNTSVRSL
jgi:purine nucleosidase